MKEAQTAILLTCRRRDLMMETSTGKPLKEVIPLLAQRYEVEENTLYADWANRESWLGDLIQFDANLPKRYFVELDATKEKAWFQYYTADNSNAKVGALRVVKDCLSIGLDVMVKSGYFKKENAPVDVRDITVRWEAPVWMKDPKLLRQYADEQEQERAKYNDVSDSKNQETS